MVHAAHEARLASNFARTVAGARAIRRSAVPGNSGERDVEPRSRIDRGKPHERRESGKARDDRSIHRLGVLVLRDGHDSRFS
jgi:hypothetical protein